VLADYRNVADEYRRVVERNLAALVLLRVVCADVVTRIMGVL